MSIINRRNEALNVEGYYDPTTFNAIKNIEGLYDSNDVNRRNYIEKKIIMLRTQFLVHPTTDEITHLFELKSEYAIDKAVEHIIKKHWEED